MPRIQEPGYELDLSTNDAMTLVLQCGDEKLRQLKQAVKRRVRHYKDDDLEPLWASIRKSEPTFLSMLSGWLFMNGRPDDFDSCISEVQRHIYQQVTEEVRAQKEAKAAKAAKANQQTLQKRAAVTAADSNEDNPPSAKRARLTTDPPTQMPDPRAAPQITVPELPTFDLSMTTGSMIAAMSQVRDDMSAQFSKSTGECMKTMESELKAAVAGAVKAQEALSEERMHDLSAQQERVAAREKAADLREQRLDSDIFKLRSDECLWFGKQRDHETKEKVLAEQEERLSRKEISIALREGEVERTENRSNERAKHISAREEVVYQREKDQKANKAKWEADMTKRIRAEMLEEMSRALTQLK